MTAADGWSAYSCDFLSLKEIYFPNLQPRCRNPAIELIRNWVNRFAPRGSQNSNSRKLSNFIFEILLNKYRFSTLKYWWRGLIWMVAPQALVRTTVRDIWNASYSKDMQASNCLENSSCMIKINVILYWFFWLSDYGNRQEWTHHCTYSGMLY